MKKKAIYQILIINLTKIPPNSKKKSSLNSETLFMF